ncbi:unnamed protein product [Lampetra fluviatilis]
MGDVISSYTTENDISWHDVIWENKIKLIAWIREDPSDLLDELDCKHIINREVYKQAKEINDSKKQSRFLVDHFIDSQKEDCKKFLQSLRDVKNSYHLELQDWIENIGLQEPTYGHSLTVQQSRYPQKSKGGWNKSQQDISKKFSDTKSVDTGSDRQRSVPTSQESDNARTDEQSEDQGRIKPASLGTKATHLQSVRNTINRFEDKTQTIKRPISYNAEPSYSKEIGDKKFISTSTYRKATSFLDSQDFPEGYSIVAHGWGERSGNSTGSQGQITP